MTSSPCSAQPWRHLPWQPPPTGPTRLVYLNVHQTFPPLSGEAIPPPAPRANSIARSAIKLQEALTVAKLTGVLRIVVLGASPTSGCGAVETEGNLTRQCSIELSWGRRMHDAVVRIFGGVSGWRLPIETRIYSRNAVQCSFFERCTAEMVPANTAIVLLETGTNLWQPTDKANEAELEATAYAIQRAAPSTWLAFVMWPHNEMRKRVRYPLLVSRVAQRLGLGMVEVFEQHGPHPWLLDGGANASFRCAPRCSMYAQLGEDLVHPNPQGHRLLARRVAATVASGLLAAWCGKHIPKTRVAPPLSGKPASAPAPAPAQMGRSDELCYPSADRLPLQRSASDELSWKLRDEGAVDKGVRKLGYVSTQVGAVLRLVLTRDEGARLGFERAGLRARLGYLLSVTGCHLNLGITDLLIG